MPRYTDPYPNPFVAAHACAKANGVARDRLARAILVACKRFEPFDLAKTIAFLATRCGIHVEPHDRGWYRAWYDTSFQPRDH